MFASIAFPFLLCIFDQTKDNKRCVLIFTLKLSFILNWPVIVSAYTRDVTGLSGVCARPGCSVVLPEASSQPLSHTVPQCTAAPQRLRPGLLRTGPQHPATLWYVHTQAHTHIQYTGICEVRYVNRANPSG